MDVTFLTAQTVALIPVVVGVVAAIRAATPIADRYAPLVSLVVGVAGAFIFPAVSVGLTVLAGVVVGLSASGLYSGGKTLVQG